MSFKKTGVKALTINALYPFEDVKVLKENIEKLKDLIAEAKRINCPQIVLCPLNDANDKRSTAQRADELVTALSAYGPLFAEAKMIGLVEPLGFTICSLRTKKTALEGIAGCHYPTLARDVGEYIARACFFTSDFAWPFERKMGGMAVFAGNTALMRSRIRS